MSGCPATANIFDGTAWSLLLTDRGGLHSFIEMRVAPKVEEVPRILFFCLIDKHSSNLLKQKKIQKNDGELFGNCIQKFPPKKSSIFLTIFFIYIFGINLDILSTSWHIFF